MASVVQLTEPQVLAHTKGRLFRDPIESNTYAVCDTQFAMDEWLSGRPIAPEIRERGGDRERGSAIWRPSGDC